MRFAIGQRFGFRRGGIEGKIGCSHHNQRFSIAADGAMPGTPNNARAG
jgi:hypothetical protein